MNTFGRRGTSFWGDPRASPKGKSEPSPLSSIPLNLILYNRSRLLTMAEGGSKKGGELDRVYERSSAS